jgi:hypothetical protein
MVSNLVERLDEEQREHVLFARLVNARRGAPATPALDPLSHFLGCQLSLRHGKNYVACAPQVYCCLEHELSRAQEATSIVLWD